MRGAGACYLCVYNLVPPSHHSAGQAARGLVASHGIEKSASCITHDWTGVIVLAKSSYSHMEMDKIVIVV